jgi:hypothetical protein
MIEPGRNDIRAIAVVLLALCLITPSFACPYDTGGHLVNIRAIGSHTDRFGFVWQHPIINATITATGIQKEQPAWLWSLLGQMPIDTSIDLIEHNATTDENGIATLALYDTMLYNVTVVCDSGRTTAFKLYPSENEYNLYMYC